ncbi:MAG: lytic transglycosylase [Syntrophus sp. (in: bacteria)]|nr:lytic transglycosylase [Syntrophus sp. (in: bacteria)]
MKKWIMPSLSIFLLIIGAVLPAAARGDIYKYVDAEGVIHLTNVPTSPNIKYDLVLRERRVLFRVKPTDITKYDHLITRASEKYNVDAALVKAVIKAESNFDHKAVSPKGARGLMQLMPATAISLDVRDSFHPENNIEGGVRYLRYLLNIFKGNLSLALAAYNAGEAAVARHHYSVPPFRETQTYVRRVLHYLAQYRNEEN